MKRLLIAIRARLLAEALESALSSRFEIYKCSTGADARSLLKNLQPEALIVDLRLPECDGLSILESCGYQPPAVVVLTDVINEEIVQMAGSAGVGALVPIPCSAGHVAEILACLTAKTPSPEG